MQRMSKDNIEGGTKRYGIYVGNWRCRYIFGKFRTSRYCKTGVVGVDCFGNGFTICNTGRKRNYNECQKIIWYLNKERDVRGVPKINIDGRYPCKANWVILKSTKNGIVARNCLNQETVKLTDRQAKYLMRLDGNRNPCKIKGFTKQECEAYYDYLDSEVLIRDEGRTLHADGIMLHTVYIPERKYAGTIIPKILNSLLWLTFLPVFLYGLFRLSRYDIEFGMNCNYFFANVITGIVGGLLLGMILHEVGHAIACLANMKGAFLEAGFMIRGILPGAYVMIDATDVTNRRKKAQIYLAGIEVNLLLSGLLMILMTSVRENSFLGEWKIAMLYAVVQNVILALINISLVENFDGEHTMRALFGGPIVDAAKANLKQMFSSKKRRNYFRKNGLNGIANICTSVVVLVFQIFIPLLILAEISIFVGGVFS
jgi:hypothetical protein